jgi:hypothetical protein
MKQPRSTVLGLLLALSLGVAYAAPAASAGNGSSAPAPSGSTAPANGAPQATTPPSPTLSDLGRSLRSYFSDEDLDILFQYMRDSVIAAFKGEEVFLPPDLSFKLEILLVRMKREGGHYMDNLIDQLEKDLERNLKEKLKEKLAPPDTSTSTYIPPQPPAYLPFFFPPAVTAPSYPAYPIFTYPSPPAFGPPQTPAPLDP